MTRMVKKIVTLVLVILLLLLGVTGFGCYPEEKINELEAEIDRLNTRVVAQEGQRSEQATRIRKLESEIAGQDEQIAERDEQIAERDEIINQKNIQVAKLDEKLKSTEGLRNPTYEELMDFLKEDQTDRHGYSVPDYQIFHFAADLNNNAEKVGKRAGYVRLWLGSDHGWRLVAFETTDKGLVFIEPCTDEVVPQLVVGESFQQRDWKEALEITSFIIVW